MTNKIAFCDKKYLNNITEEIYEEFSSVLPEEEVTQKIFVGLKS